mmetsp:Transcript_45932/g.99182  ORF Transcript_45932/g.99182 Transcript_45932/m.99182 type:complete len:529 (+) Transcript_45932:381-1967(+)
MPIADRGVTVGTPGQAGRRGIYNIQPSESGSEGGRGVQSSLRRQQSPLGLDDQRYFVGFIWSSGAPVDVDALHLADAAVDASIVDAAAPAEVGLHNLVQRAFVGHKEVSEARAEAPEASAAPQEGLEGPCGIALSVERRPQRRHVALEVDAANVAPVGAEVLPLDPVRVSLLLEAQLLPDVGILLPLGAAVGPGAFPIACTDRSSHLDEPEVLLGMERSSNCADVQHSQSVRVGEPLGLASGLHTAATERRPSAMVVSKELEELSRVILVPGRLKSTSSSIFRVFKNDKIAALPGVAVAADLVAPGLAPGHADQGPLCDALLYGPEAAAKLGEGLLQDHRPQLLDLGVAELGLWSAAGVSKHAVRGTWVNDARDEVVDDEGAPELLLRVKQPHDVAAARVDFWRQEQGCYSLLSFGQNGEGRAEPAVVGAIGENVLDVQVALEKRQAGAPNVGPGGSLPHIRATEIHGANPDNLLATLRKTLLEAGLPYRGGLGRKLVVHEEGVTAAEKGPEQPPAIDPNTGEEVDSN